MSNARKLQTEIERTMKKVDEGVELFDEIWDKLYAAEQQNQKEKYEGELKKEIKKLQRLRDQLKTWISGNDVKDKEPLLEARKLIETKMEAFKTCEKEMKTKTYSKEGLARSETLSPEEEAKQKTSDWILEIMDRLTTLVQDQEVEIERLQAGKGKKTNKHLLDECKHYMAMHKFHLNKLDGILRLVNNDVLDVEIVDPLKDDLDYYLDGYQDEDYQQAYDEEFFYESLGLEALDVVNVDRLATAENGGKGAGKGGGGGSVHKDDDAESKNSKGSSKDTRKSKKASSGGIIPLTIGRARASKGGGSIVEPTPTATHRGSLMRDVSIGSSIDDHDDSTGGKNNTPTKKKPKEVTPTTIPAARQAPPGAPSGASMAAILKRESEQQEKERLAKAEQLRQAQQAQQQAALRQQQEAQLRQQEAAAQQQRQEAAAKQKALQEQQQQQQATALHQQQEAQLRQQQQQQQAAALAAQQQLQQQDAAAKPTGAVGPSSSGGTGGTGGGGLDILSGLGALNLNSGPNPENGVAAAAVAAAASGNNNSMVQESFATLPTASDQDRNRTYTPQNPYPNTPPSYPGTPSTLFDNPAIYEKLGTDALFFIFYYKQGTYQQYLAARELKKQSWRFHKKYMTWFQRHEEPKVTTDEYEQGTYVYFDYETGWCTRIKQDFRFEYSFLEDSLQ